MEQPRPLRRRRRSSRRSAGPPGGAGTGAASESPTPTGPLTAGPPIDSGSAIPPSGDQAHSGDGSDVARRADLLGDEISTPATGDGTNPQVTAVANAGFAAPAELDDPLAGSAAAPGAPHTFAGSPGTAASTGPTHPAEHGRPSGEGPRRSYRTPREDQSERSLRALVTTRSTQVSPTAAMRAREVAVPTAADVLAAEVDLVVVRRHYVPPTALAAGRRRDRTERRPSGGGHTGGNQAGGSQSGDNPPAGGQPTGHQPS